MSLLIAAGIALFAWALLRTNGSDGSSALAPSATVLAATQATVVPPTPGVPIAGASVIGTGLYGGMDWSPDGRSIAFVQNFTLFRADAPDFTPHLLADASSGILPVSISSPRWSPDGTRIAFVGNRAGRSGNPDMFTGTVWLINADGSGLRDLLAGAAAELSTSTAKIMQGWIDDNTLSFAEHCGTECSLLYLLDVTTEKFAPEINIANQQTAPAGALGPTYYPSANRRWIAADGTPNQIVIYNTGTHNATGLRERATLPVPWQWFDSWAPDSSEFLYHQAANNGGGSGFQPPVSLFSYDVTTGESKLITSPATDGAWSKDGTRIAYVTEATADRPCGDSGAATACEAVVDTASGRELYRVTGPGMFALNSGDDNLPLPVFFGDGRLIYAGYQGNEVRIANDGKSQVLAATKGLVDYQISPDERYILISEAGIAGRILVVAIPAEQP